MKNTIVFQGRRGAFSESAAYHLFGKNIEVLPKDSFEELHKAVSDGDVFGGVIPIENSTAGSILENYDLLLKYKLPIVGEVKLQIEHCLVALKGETIDSLSKVISHPQALGQCSWFFEKNPHIKKEAFFDTAGSAEEIANKQLRGVGGIASKFAAEHYGLSVLQESLENYPRVNSTRFFAIQKNAVPSDINDSNTKTSIAFFLNKNIPGALHKCLGCFAEQNVDLISIESRPKEGSPWEYIFYADLAGHHLQKSVKQSIENLKATATVFLLGSYIRGENKYVEF